MTNIFFIVTPLLEFLGLLTPGSPRKFLMADFVRVFAQKVTAEICPVQPIVSCTTYPQMDHWAHVLFLSLSQVLALALNHDPNQTHIDSYSL